MDGDTLSALRVCFEYLPSYLKQCFKYCSLFPKEYIFPKQHLVRLWLSQGFIEPADGRELEDIGAEYFDYFLSLSFFQPSFFPGETEDKFVMAGLIHDLALRFSKNECFQFEGCMQGAPENACHLSLVPHEFQSVSLSQIIARTKNLQTLSVVSRCAFHNQSISSSIIDLVDPKDLIGEFQNLVTLNLSNTDIEELPGTFGSLTNLCYLSLSSTKIKGIPLEISNLIQLQTLEAKDCDYLEELPRSIEALTNLRYLDVTKEAGYVVMPHGIGNLTHLRNLATFNVGKDALVHCGIDELKDMQHLKGCLQISGLVNVRSASDVYQAHMRRKEYIETICFNWSDGMSSLEGDEYAETAEEVLESLHPTDNLKEIIIRDYPGNIFPKWIECAAFTRLISVIFDHCYNCERWPALGALPSLKFLTIQQMYSVERMNLSGSDDVPENIIRYPSLEQFSIWEMYELVEWVELQNGSFPVLHSLSINRCPFLRNIPKFPALVELSVYSCAQFVEEMELPSLQSLRIEGLQKTKYVWLSKNLVRLMKLEIGHCPELLSVEGLSLLNSLETIIISGCPQLDFNGALDERQFTFDLKGNCHSVWSRKKTLAFDNLDLSGSSMQDEGQDQPIALKKRVEFPTFTEEILRIVTPFLDVETTDALVVLQKFSQCFSSESYSPSKKLSSDDINIMEICMEIVCELSSEDNTRSEIFSSGYLRVIASLLSYEKLAVCSLKVLEIYSTSEEGAQLIGENPKFISCLVELLETSTNDKKEVAVSILYLICSLRHENCYVVRDQYVVPALVHLSVNGSEIATETSHKLLQLLRDLREDDSDLGRDSGIVGTCNKELVLKTWPIMQKKEEIFARFLSLAHF